VRAAAPEQDRGVPCVLHLGVGDRVDGDRDVDVTGAPAHDVAADLHRALDRPGAVHAPATDGHRVDLQERMTAGELTSVQLERASGAHLLMITSTV